MRITGVNIFTYKKQAAKRPMVVCEGTFPKPETVNHQLRHDIYVCSPSFTANSIRTHGQFRFLTKDHNIHCLYCKKPLLYGGTLQDMLESGVFSKPIKDFVEEVKPYRKSMKKGQRAVFDQIQHYAKKSPQTHLSEIVQYLYQNSIKRLVKTQSGIFKSLINESKHLSADEQKEFRKFMKIQHKRLYEIPYKEEFNAEKFSYKINKMVQSIPNEELKTYLKKITTPLADEVFKDNRSIVPQELGLQITKSKLGKLKTSKDFSEYVIQRVQKIGSRLNRQDIVRLCQTSHKMINGQPVVITFSNKEFMEELVKRQLAGISKTPLYYKMVNIANKLPNSTSNNNSFVVKHRYSDSDTIGYKLLEPSIATLEHVKPKSQGGADEIWNWVLACKADNNERGSIPQYLYMNKWNLKNPQVFFNDIIKLSNEEHLINPNDIEGMAKSVSTEGHLKINTSKLKK